MDKEFNMNIVLTPKMFDKMKTLLGCEEHDYNEVEDVEDLTQAFINVTLDEMR